MKRTIIIIISILVVLLIFAIVYQDYLPPDNNIKYSRRITDLDIKKDINIKSCTENWSFTGDGEFKLIAFLPDNKDKLIEQIKDKNYNELPIKNNDENISLLVDTITYKYLNPSLKKSYIADSSKLNLDIEQEMQGYYLFNSNDGVHDLVVVDLDKNEILIYRIVI